MSEKPLHDAFAIRGLFSGLRSPDVYDGLGFGLIFFRHDSRDRGFYVFSGRPLSSDRAELWSILGTILHGGLLC